jgi:hypothetical protein
MCLHRRHRRSDRRCHWASVWQVLLTRRHVAPLVRVRGWNCSRLDGSHRPDWLVKENQQALTLLLRHRQLIDWVREV